MLIGLLCSLYIAVSSSTSLKKANLSLPLSAKVVVR